MPATGSDRLLSLLRQRQVATAAQLMGDAGISQPTLSRWLKATPGVVRMGRARATRYGLAHAIGAQGSRWPLYRLNAQARPELLGHLQALHGGKFLLESALPLPALTHDEFADGLYPGLPWFLNDQRPQGFLGRIFARRVAPSIAANPDVTLWTGDDIAHALLRFGADMPGDLVLGDAALQAAMAALLEPVEGIAVADISSTFTQLADAVLRGEVVGSSAAGEQPKFTTHLRDAQGQAQAVIVKFSERTDAPGGARWGQLLRCEALASDVLRQHGLPAADNQIHHADGRVFLSSQRFDRNANGGRYGFVSLAALDAAHYGHGRIHWWQFADQLQRDGWLDAENAHQLRILGWFGALIGNTDMHLGNAGLVLTDTRPLALAPAYDMLPMLWRPSTQGEVVPRVFTPVLPTPQQRDNWQHAAHMAVQFWQAVAQLPHMSQAFLDIATDAHTQVQQALQRFG